MLENIKNLVSFKYVDKYISDGNFELALETLNNLIKDDFMPAEAYLKRGMLCHKLLMFDDAYSDFTYIITHCVKKQKALYERMKLNYDISNFNGVIVDAEEILKDNPDEAECQRYKFLSLVYVENSELARSYVLEINDNNKYKTIQYIFNETAKVIASDEFAKALKLLNIIELMDPDNPMKVFQEANVYSLVGDNDKENELRKKLDIVFPKYFISHFRFTDMFEERDLMEISFLLELKIFDKLNNFEYPMSILEGYKNQMEGHIIASKEAFEKAVKINPNKPEGYVLLGETLQLMSGYDNPSYRQDAEKNYIKAMEIYEKENLLAKTEYMKRQIKHLNSDIFLKQRI